jgi:chemotaxis protein MotB
MAKKIKFEITKTAYDEEDQPWLISYADMVTLLMAFFMLLLSMSTLNKAKVEMVAQSFMQKDKMTYKELSKKIQEYIDSEKLDKQIDVKLTANGIEVSFKDKMLFDIGSADLKPGALEVMTKIGGFLNVTPAIARRKVSIHGHTDDVPIKSKIFPSNWELSSARAASVVKFFISQGCNYKRFESIGYADTRPLVQNLPDKKNGTPENRRVVVVISPESYMEDIFRPTLITK